MVRLQERIAALMESGATLSSVEQEVIEPSPLSTDEKSALWLYALAMTDHRGQGALLHDAPELAVHD
jgi:hypothetical protein